MREDIKDPRKLPAKADEIWQSASDQSDNVVSAASPPVPVPEDAALNALRQQPPPCPSPPAAPCPAPYSICPAAPSSSQNYNHCWYHHNHGDQAQHWHSPCSWVQGN